MNDQQMKEFKDVSTRTRYALVANGGCNHWEDVTRFTREDLLKLKNFGQKCLTEVEIQLRERGLTLKESDPKYAKPKSRLMASPQEIQRRARVIIASVLNPNAAAMIIEAGQQEEGPRVVVALQKMLREFQ